ncbi:hypothetical protein [Acinetobacter puyangensis]|uniref:hypothetical protein n=1 Tax=Acinetobacter puyangensis TaxID=1096779 RepID=UPI003A4D645C
MNNYRIHGRFVTRSPLSHISESISTNSYLAQDPILQPNGEIEEVFAYSGNAWRGQLRDLSATYLLEKLDTQIDLDEFHLLYSGGKIGGDQSIDILKAKLMRKIVPHVSIFGGGIGTQIMQGKLKVGSSYPLCIEALPVLHERYYCGLATKVSYADLTFEKSFTRFDDSKNFDLHEKVKVSDQHLLETKPKKKESEVSTQMRMTSELIVAGTQLVHEIELVNVSEVELGAFVAAFTRFAQAPYIGGQSNKGHGRVSYFAEIVNLSTGEVQDLIKINSELPQLSVVGQQAKDAYDEHLTKIYNAFLEQKESEIRGLLGASQCG